MLLQQMEFLLSIKSAIILKNLQKSTGFQMLVFQKLNIQAKIKFYLLLTKTGTLTWFLRMR